MKRIDPSQPSVALLGNLFVDRVYRLGEWPRRNRSNFATSSYENLGGVANVARRLRELDPQLDLRLWTAVGDDDIGVAALRSLAAEGLRIDEVRVVRDESTTSAAILVDEALCERTSIVALGACTEARLVDDSARVDWCHVAYLDTSRGVDAHDLRSLRERGALISVDLCLAEFEDHERTRLLDAFACTDFLVISDVECRALLGSAGPDAARELGRTVAGWAIVHHADGSWFANRRRCFEIRIERDPDIKDVLGAGDDFAAALIHRLRVGDAIDVAVGTAHELTTHSLKVRA